MKPVCVPCQRFFRMKKSGYAFIEGMPANGAERPASGTSEPDKWKPYKIWVGDLHECQGCGAQILSGFGIQPVSEHYRSDFAEKIAVLGADRLQVNDC